jgi:glycosyltransferase involved in cell wall biosynthesis
MTAQGRVAIFIPCLVGGGAEMAMLRLAGGLAKSGVSVDFLVSNSLGTLSKEVPDNMAQMPAGVELIDFKSWPPRASVLPLANYLKSRKPTNLISFGHNASVIAILATKLSRVRTRNILTIQNNYSAEVKGASSRHDKLILMGARVFYGLADVVTAVSQGVADDLAAAFGRQKNWVKVIYNPIVSDEIITKSRQPAEHEFFQDKDIPVILSVGRLEPQKDYPVLLKAFARVRKNRSCRLIILGQGFDRPALEKLVDDLEIGKDVSLPGYADNPYAYMKQASLFVLSSIHEGLPTVLIEALACGCPVVSTDCPSGPMEILEGGKWGQLVPMKDVDALAAAIEASLSKPKAAPPEESWMRYTIDASVLAYSEIMQECS